MPRQPVPPAKTTRASKPARRTHAHPMPVVEPALPHLLFTVKDAARALGIGETLMYRLIEREEIDSIKIGRLRRVTREALDAFVARKASAASAS